jgi:hypothetical protein
MYFATFFFQCLAQLMMSITLTSETSRHSHLINRLNMLNFSVCHFHSSTFHLNLLWLGAFQQKEELVQPTAELAQER